MDTNQVAAEAFSGFRQIQLALRHGRAILERTHTQTLTLTLPHARTRPTADPCLRVKVFVLIVGETFPDAESWWMHRTDSSTHKDALLNSRSLPFLPEARAGNTTGHRFQ